MTTASTQRNPVVLILAGLFLGSGPIMLWLGRWKLAAAYFISHVAVAAVIFVLPLYGFFRPIFLEGIDPVTLLSASILPVSVVGIIHGLKINKMARGRPWYSKWYVALVAPTAIAMLLASSVRTFLYQPFNSPSVSNVPSLMSGDYFFVSKTAYRNGGSPQPGDLAVFKLPGDTTIDYVKRVIGLPGDHIQMINGVLNINGLPVKLEPIQLDTEFYESDGISFMRETLPNGRSYVIANLQDGGSGDNTEEYIVPAGHFFTLGDNRDNSEDSRYLDSVGYVPGENFVGPLVLRFWNSRGLRLDNRPTEFYPSN